MCHRGCSSRTVSRGLRAEQGTGADGQNASAFCPQLSAGVRPAETGHLWSWEEEESFTLEIRIEGDRLLYSETSHEHKGGTIRIAVRFVGPCEKQCPRCVLVLRGETEQVDHCRIKEYLANHSGYMLP